MVWSFSNHSSIDPGLSSRLSSPSPHPINTSNFLLLFLLSFVALFLFLAPPFMLMSQAVPPSNREFSTSFSVSAFFSCSAISAFFLSSLTSFHSSLSILSLGIRLLEYSAFELRTFPPLSSILTASLSCLERASWKLETTFISNLGVSWSSGWDVIQCLCM